MKLKKISSLALAGVMAVSMLAGCGTNGSSNTTNNDAATVPSVVAAVNNGQDGFNQVKVTFTAADTNLVNAVGKAFERYSDKSADAVTDGTMATAIAQNAVLGTFQNAIDGKFYGDQVGKGSTSLKSTATAKDGETVTYLDVIALGTAASSETYMMNMAANHINTLTAKLDDTTKVTQADKDNGATAAITKKGDTYYDFSYTGSVYVTKVTNSYGVDAYYLVTVLQQTVAKKTA